MVSNSLTLRRWVAASTLCASVLSLTAQPRLENNVLPQVGTNLLLQPAYTNAIKEGNAGANQVWDFSALQPKVGAQFTLQYVDAAQTPYADKFPFGNIATIYKSLDGTASYSYFNQTGNELWFLGSSYAEAEEVYENPNLLVRTPMNFGQSLTGNYDGIQKYDDFETAIYGYKTLQFDGYGTLKLPGKTYPNAMRTRTEETRTDSVTSFTGGAYTLNLTKSVTYAWFVPGSPLALMEIRYTNLTTKTYIPGIPLQVSNAPQEKDVVYQPNATTPTAEVGLGIQGLDITLQSANPFSDPTLILLLQSDRTMDARLDVLSANGTLLSTAALSIVAGRQTQSLDFDNLPPGTYWVRLSNAQGSLGRKVVKID